METTQNILTQNNAFQTLTGAYKVIPSQNLIEMLGLKGFTLNTTVKNKVRRKDKDGYQKHRLIFDMPEDVPSQGGKFQLLITNSYDGTSGVIFQLGYFRLVCANGLVFGDTFAKHSIRHTGVNFSEKIEHAITTITAQARELGRLIERMKGIQLSSLQIKELQLEAAQIRASDKNVIEVNFHVMREADQANDLFTVYNVIQEGLIRGTAHLTLVEDGKPSIKKIRKLKSFTAMDKINSQLFELINTKYCEVA